MRIHDWWLSNSVRETGILGAGMTGGLAKIILLKIKLINNL